MSVLRNIAIAGAVALGAASVAESARWIVTSSFPISSDDIPRLVAFVTGTAPAADRTAPDDFDRTFNAAAVSLGRSVRILFRRCGDGSRRSCWYKTEGGIDLNVEGEETPKYLSLLAMVRGASSDQDWRDACDVAMQAFSPGLLNAERSDFMARLERAGSAGEPGSLVVNETFYMVDKDSFVAKVMRPPVSVRASRR